MKTAIVVGATGMVGAQLVTQLLASDKYIKIISLVRRNSGVVHPKLEEHCINFDEPALWRQWVKGDVLFSCLGTTIAKAKSKDAQYKVDYTYQYEVARIASEQGVENYVLVSSAGANSSSATFYMRIKGELDDAVRALPFKNISILRPGQLAGQRTEYRLGEKMGLWVMYRLNQLGLFAQYKPIDASQVAAAMIEAAEDNVSNIYTLNEVFQLAERRK